MEFKNVEALYFSAVSPASGTLRQYEFEFKGTELRGGDSARNKHQRWQMNRKDIYQMFPVSRQILTHTRTWLNDDGIKQYSSVRS